MKFIQYNYRDIFMLNRIFNEFDSLIFSFLNNMNHMKICIVEVNFFEPWCIAQTMKRMLFVLKLVYNVNMSKW